MKQFIRYLIWAFGTIAIASIVNIRCSTPPQVLPASRKDTTGWYHGTLSPITMVKYTLEDSCTVLILIYNVQGEVVDTLVNEQQGPGRYSKEWVPAAPPPPGVYFSKLSCGGKSYTQKLFLPK